MTEHIPVIEARNLSVYYLSGAIISRRRYSIRNLTFHVHENETVGLAGPSGCGKTSVGKAILGLLPTWEGDIYWSGKNIRNGISHTERRRFGWIGQESALSFNPSRKIIATLRETLRVNDITDTGDMLIRGMCERMNLDYRILSRYPFELSGGQVQRCALMRAFLTGPRFLVLDEPTSSLDPINQMEILQLIMSWRKESSMSLLIISHSQSLLSRYCDRIIRLDSANDRS